MNSCRLPTTRISLHKTQILFGLVATRECGPVTYTLVRERDAGYTSAPASWARPWKALHNRPLERTVPNHNAIEPIRRVYDYVPKLLKKLLNRKSTLHELRSKAHVVLSLWKSRTWYFLTMPETTCKKTGPIFTDPMADAPVLIRILDKFLVFYMQSSTICHDSDRHCKEAYPFEGIIMLRVFAVRQ